MLKMNSSQVFLMNTVFLIMNIFGKRIIMKKILIVSGGSEGLGLALTESLLRSGRDVLILGRDCEKLNRAAKKLGHISEKSHISTLVCNIGNESDVKKTGLFLKQHTIVTEYLFNNAGRGLSGDVAEKIVNAVLDAGKLTVTDITINRKK